MENKIAIPVIVPENRLERAMDVSSAPKISINTQILILSTLTKTKHREKHTSHLLQSPAFSSDNTSVIILFCMTS